MLSVCHGWAHLMLTTQWGQYCCYSWWNIWWDPDFCSLFNVGIVSRLPKSNDVKQFFRSVGNKKRPHSSRTSVWIETNSSYFISYLLPLGIQVLGCCPAINRPDVPSSGPLCGCGRSLSFLLWSISSLAPLSGACASPCPLQSEGLAPLGRKQSAKWGHWFLLMLKTLTFRNISEMFPKHLQETRGILIGI